MFDFIEASAKRHIMIDANSEPLIKPRGSLFMPRQGERR
jgi:hypothetical protein